MAIKKFIDGSRVIKRINLSPYHIWAADHFASLTKEIEKDFNNSSPPLEIINIHRACVISSIFSAFAFLESLINEFFADAADNIYGLIREKKLSVDLVKQLASMWKFREGFSTLDKYQVALVVVKNSSFPDDSHYLRGFKNLRDLRNALIHYQPEWATEHPIPDSEISNRLKRKLEGYKFPLNPFAVNADPFFPIKCLSSGCAKWAKKCSVNFADEFFTRLGLPIPYPQVSSELNLK